MRVVFIATWFDRSELIYFVKKKINIHVIDLIAGQNAFRISSLLCFALEWGRLS